VNDVHSLLARCRELGAEFTPTPDGKIKVRAPAPLPDELRQELKQRKSEILTLLTRPAMPTGRLAEQRELFQPRRSVPPPASPSADADYWTQRCNAVLDQWRRKEWGPCQRCG
jgi:TubC N-terminal docking domain